MVLSVETSTKALSVSLSLDREIINIDIIHEVARSQNIVSTVKFLLKSIGKSINDIREVYAGIGPGSFTGIRIGLSFVNTLSQIQDIPTLGISSLDLLAFEDNRWYNSVVPFIRSRKNEVYTAYYEKEKRITKYLALARNDLFNFIKENRPAFLVTSEEDYNNIGLEGELDFRLKTIFSFPKARILPLFARKCGLKPERKYLKPLYVRGL